MSRNASWESVSRLRQLDVLQIFVGLQVATGVDVLPGGDQTPVVVREATHQAGVDDLLKLVSVSRQTAFKWYSSIQGMILAGLVAAQTSFMAELEEFHQKLVEHPKLVIGRALSRSGKRRTAVFAASAAAEVFGEYCRLLNDPSVCGGIVLRAAAEFPDPESEVHRFATECFIKHLEYLSEILKQEEIDQPAARTRLLVAAAAGLFSLPRSAIGQETSFLPLFFQAITHEGGQIPRFSPPHPPQHGLVTDAEGAGDAPDVHAIQVGAGDLILELLVVAGTLRLENERAPARQALGSLIPVFGVAFLRTCSLPQHRQTWTMVVESIPKPHP